MGWFSNFLDLHPRIKGSLGFTSIAAGLVGEYVAPGSGAWVATTALGAAFTLQQASESGSDLRHSGAERAEAIDANTRARIDSDLRPLEPEQRDAYVQRLGELARDPEGASLADPGPGGAAAELFATHQQQEQATEHRLDYGHDYAQQLQAESYASLGPSQPQAGPADATSAAPSTPGVEQVGQPELAAPAPEPEGAPAPEPEGAPAAPAPEGAPAAPAPETAEAAAPEPATATTAASASPVPEPETMSHPTAEASTPEPTAPEPAAPEAAAPEPDVTTGPEPASPGADPPAAPVPAAEPADARSPAATPADRPPAPEPEPEAGAAQLATPSAAAPAPELEPNASQPTTPHAAPTPEPASQPQSTPAATTPAPEPEPEAGATKPTTPTPTATTPAPEPEPSEPESGPGAKPEEPEAGL
ncbi:MAG: hypothetical protein QM711_04865 [Micropruina sp.]|uniref:hypothetical protein n=1 Tax=Micropruina sp. TaxID=2737536 RepID=UPI0039E4AFDE